MEEIFIVTGADLYTCSITSSRDFYYILEYTFVFKPMSVSYYKIISFIIIDLRFELRPTVFSELLLLKMMQKDLVSKNQGIIYNSGFYVIAFLCAYH